MLQPSRDLLFYQAPQCHAEFVIHAEGIALQGEIVAHLHRLEVRSEVAVVLSGYRDVAAVIDARVALHAPRQRLHEGEVLVVEELVNLHVAAQYALIVLTDPHDAVVVQHCFYVHAQMRVVVKYLFHFLLLSGMPRSHTRAPPHNRKVRLAYGPTLDHFSR